jgi:ribulose-phosphate 3-epimerase
MIERPERQIDAFIAAGADTITFHVEATPHVNYVVQQIRAGGCQAGIAFCPSTPLATLEEVDCDLALCMSVNPGWGGQKFIESSIEKLSVMRSLVSEGTIVEVDGGIASDTAAGAATAGAGWLVAGSAVFGSSDPAAAFTALTAAARGD